MKIEEEKLNFIRVIEINMSGKVVDYKDIPVGDLSKTELLFDEDLFNRWLEEHWYLIE